MSRAHVRLDRGRWARVRLQVLDAANWRCAVCGGYGNEVDHIIPLHKGGDPWSLDNLQVLCRTDPHRQDSTRERATGPGS